MAQPNTMISLGIEIPASARNNNCVQDSAARLLDLLRLSKGRERSYVTEARANLQAWIDHAGAV